MDASHVGSRTAALFVMFRRYTSRRRRLQLQPLHHTTRRVYFSATILMRGFHLRRRRVGVRLYHAAWHSIDVRLAHTRI